MINNQDKNLISNKFIKNFLDNDSESVIAENDKLSEIIYSLGFYLKSFSNIKKLLDYISLILKQIFEEKYYRHLSGGILEAFGRMFNRDLKLYLYPYQKQKDGEITNSKNINIHPRFRSLYEYLVYNQRIIDIDYDPKVLNIFSPVVLRMIKNGINGWEDMVPAYVDNVIKQKRLFGYKMEHKK